MDTRKTIEKVAAFAEMAHEGQKRKYTPDRYMVHPIRVMEICREHTDDVCILSAALLHDVLEDTAVDRDALFEFLVTVMPESDARRTLSLVVDLTDVYVKKDYPSLNRKRRKEKERERIANTSADSQTVKYADIIDNCSEIVQHDRDFAGVFLRECKVLLQLTVKGDPDLYRRAKEQVEQSLARLRGAR
jgi:guanosine-3',5'-bis(diphosphate) 3'-pyrophosphohydrolase